MPDWIVGAQQGDGPPGADKPGYARVFSGADGSELYTFVGDNINDTFGRRVSGAGDVDGDGFDDVVVGAPLSAANGLNSGYARVFSGATGATLYTFIGNQAEDQFGDAVSGAGDVNGDSYDDVVIGAPQPSLSIPTVGYVKVFSGLTGGTIHVLAGFAVGDRFGKSVSDLADLDGDGRDDFIVGAPEDAGLALPGYAQVFSGAAGTPLVTVVGDGNFDRFGTSVAKAGDLDGDGDTDWVVGAPGTGNQSRPAYVRTFNGPLGTELFTIPGNLLNNLGIFVSGAGDVDAAGFDDILVGSTGTLSTSFLVNSGQSGTLIDFFNDARSIGPLGDLNGDGYDDIGLGVLFGSSGSMEPGTVQVLTFAPPCDDADMDGYGASQNVLCQFPGIDCDDSNAAVHPGAAEIPGNGIDENCNGNDLCGSIPAPGSSGAVAAYGLIALAFAGLLRRR
ncbi:MAG: FG-GAP repeat protein [Myxococcales bacterium]|nr:FG-GAP repeat protein [Myxococcales bacterium]